MQNLFVVGTGRCGSTLISNLLKSHPNVLSLSEFFTFITDLGTLIPAAFPETPISANTFWNIIATPYKKQNIMQQRDICMNEVLYRATESSYFPLSEGVPAIMQTTLPHISEQPEKLFQELKSFVLALPTATAADLYKTTFAWLCKKYGKAIWAERSGGSLRVVHRLQQHFPDAKFLHIVRDGRTTALSMQQHYGFRMAMIVFQLTEVLGVDPFENSDREWASDLPDDIAHFLPEHFDAQAFKDYHIDSSLYGHYWSGEIIQGLEEFAKIPEDQKLTITYENLLCSPHESITTIGEFIGNTEIVEQWATQCANMIRTPTSSLDKLNAEERARLEKACAPGMAALQKAGTIY